jgi:site-specific DNA-methyltransferase (adenine-specific)
MSDYTLHHGDCLDILPTLAPGSVDAVICDPPYGITFRLNWDVPIDVTAMWHQLKRIIKPQGSIVLFSSQPFTSLLVSSNLDMFRYEWVWNKSKASAFLMAAYMPMKAHENILVFTPHPIAPKVKQRPVYNPQGLVHKGLQILRHRARSTTISGYGNYEGKAIDSYSNYPTSSLYFKCETGLHPTQKPIALLEYLVKTYTNAGDTVLDFTFGSGTTGAACGNLGRRFVGIERDAEYFRLGSERIATAYAPLRAMQAAAVEG